MERKTAIMTNPTRPPIDRAQRRVVCAALRKAGSLVVIGPRHFDDIMQESISQIGGEWHMADQGFIDQWGKFMSRKEAFEVATAAKQILKKTGNASSKELFSEDIY